ncbi:hypothetical protein AMTRI_Chr11g97640 [Amborella trichopoda]
MASSSSFCLVFLFLLGKASTERSTPIKIPLTSRLSGYFISSGKVLNEINILIFTIRSEIGSLQFFY